MTCQFTLFNSIPTATKPTDADVKDKVDGVCAVSLMTEDTCKSLPSTLLINNPKNLEYWDKKYWDKKYRELGVLG